MKLFSGIHVFFLIGERKKTVITLDRVRLLVKWLYYYFNSIHRFTIKHILLVSFIVFLFYGSV